MKIEINKHDAWRKSLVTTTPAPDRFDEIDDYVADAERHLNQRSRHGKNSVLRILDQIERGEN